MIFIPLKPIITKKYSVPRQQFTANQAVKFAAADIKMNHNALASSIGTCIFSGISSNEGFMYSLYLYTNGTVSFVTNITQYLQFEIVWQEYI
ncbi:hypothetical protein DWX17_21775 [[Clostridium] innocuum]|jgi:hypothetical protein|nr:hypothetical protein DWX17_21775 [[Clostridium] innocuum]